MLGEVVWIPETRSFAIGKRTMIGTALRAGAGSVVGRAAGGWAGRRWAEFRGHQKGSEAYNRSVNRFKSVGSVAGAAKGAMTNKKFNSAVKSEFGKIKNQARNTYNSAKTKGMNFYNDQKLKFSSDQVKTDTWMKQHPPKTGYLVPASRSADYAAQKEALRLQSQGYKVTKKDILANKGQSPYKPV